MNLFGFQIFFYASCLIFAVYFPACLVCAAVLYKTPGQKIGSLIAMMLNPALIIIDHGHFQYNSISLGSAVRRKKALNPSSTLLNCFFSKSIVPNQV